MQARYVYYLDPAFPLPDWRGAAIDTFTITCSRSEVDSSGIFALLSDGDKALMETALGNPSWVGPGNCLVFLVARDKSSAQLTYWSCMGNVNAWAKKAVFTPIGNVTDNVPDGATITNLDDLAPLVPKPV